jgi:uroporphyrinogen-III synthase
VATLSDAYESALEKLVERGRALLASVTLFAVGIALAGAVRTIQLNDLDSQEQLTAALGTTWEPIESL